jgi:hypothetical protein
LSKPHSGKGIIPKPSPVGKLDRNGYFKPNFPNLNNNLAGHIIKKDGVFTLRFLGG